MKNKKGMISEVKKNKKGININHVLIAIIVIALIIYAIYSIVNLAVKPTDSFFVENGKISFEESVYGYIIRDETVIKGENYKNGISQIKAEGEKVAKSEPIYRYYTKNEEELIQKINNLDIKISEAMEKEKNIYTADIKNLENQIYKKIYEVSNINDIQKIKEYKSELNSIVTKKAKIAGEYSPSGSYLKQLIEERSKYENELNNGSEYIKAVRSGVVSYRVDGLEETLTTSSLASLNKDMLENLKLKTGQIVPTSDESGKIVDNFYCYIACVLKNENIEAADVKVGSNLKIRLSNSKEVTANVEYISGENNDESLVILKIEKYVEELINYRKISLDILWWSETGLKVPNEAIKYETDNLAYVVRKRVGYTDDIYIKILKQSDKYSIIENYTYKELEEKGLSEEKLKNRKTISLYDELEN